MEEFKPGQVISPHAATSSAVEPPAAPAGAPEPERPTEQPSRPDPVPAPDQATPQNEMAEPVANWQFNQEASNEGTSKQPEDLPSEVSWTASEFIAHEKGAAWYGSLAAIGVAIAALVYLFTKDKVSTGIVTMVFIIFGVFAARKPRTQQYSLNSYGLLIGQKAYDFQNFKTFSISEEGAIVSIILMPLKRFMPPLTVYVAPDEEERVVDFLSAYLPFDQHKADAVDNLMRRIRF